MENLNLQKPPRRTPEREWVLKHCLTQMEGLNISWKCNSYNGRAHLRASFSKEGRRIAECHIHEPSNTIQWWMSPGFWRNEIPVRVKWSVERLFLMFGREFDCVEPSQRPHSTLQVGTDAPADAEFPKGGTS